MGMYTEVVVKMAICKYGHPARDMVALEYLFNGGDRRELPKDLPDHPFFRKERWYMVGACSSFYHHPAAVNDWHTKEWSDYIYIFSRSDFKNYDYEADALFDWLRTLLAKEDDYRYSIGYQWYEEDEEPTIMYNK